MILVLIEGNWITTKSPKRKKVFCLNPIPTMGWVILLPSYTFLSFSITTNTMVLKFFDFSFISISYVFCTLLWVGKQNFLSYAIFVEGT